ncbi:type II secretion system protein [Candidatus Peregrinibacteria bacterium]|jgi:prepilin-type N-terminal cleavage/methylation domain-containing protein|nr:type II secretion system protein [Candidatus Peregrinibacteria bacterium]MBT4367479.1 type II secretion system protein [Candidatus Peregrinibacteria bacterium]MBT4586073.1 type II secretion system protein [Candidatus Peregrinibacteria bacterium]MBT6730353.1 type II secretion system protein [Candidatus Peregrinibacteria bacterium]MBT7009017.1 type II secretion system protein [Candidatus Peregrinibacteria bacterium]
MHSGTLVQSKKGFTIIELIIVVAILGILSTLILIQIDPIRRLNEAHNATRWSDVLLVLEITKEYQADNDSAVPGTAIAIDSDESSVQIIGESVTNCVCASQTVVTSPCGVSGLDTDLRPYIDAMPMDPITGSTNDTRYFINKDSYGLITVGSCDAESEGSGGNGTPPNISITR